MKRDARPAPTRGRSPVAVAAAAGLVVVGPGLVVAGWFVLRPTGPPEIAGPAPTVRIALNGLGGTVPAVLGSGIDRLTDLRDGDPATKVRELNRLAAEAPKGADDLLAQAAAELSHESAAVRGAALAALRANDGAAPPGEKRVRVALFGARPEALLYAAEGYARRPAPPDVVERFGRVCDDESAAARPLRLAVVAALANCEPAAKLQALGRLADRLDDADPGVRSAALAALRRGPFAPAERLLLTDRLHPGGTRGRFKSPAARLEVARLLQADSADPDLILTAFRPLLVPSEDAAVRACALDAVLASTAAVRRCAEAGEVGPTLLGLLVSGVPGPYEPSPEARGRILAALAAAGPPSRAVVARLAATFDRDPDDTVRTVAGKQLCTVPILDAGGIAVARKLLASPLAAAADKAKVLDALAAIPAADATRNALPSTWPELWAIVAGPADPVLTLKALVALGAVVDRRPDSADAVKSRQLVEACVRLGFDPTPAGRTDSGDEVRAAVVRLLKAIPGPAIEVLADRAAKELTPRGVGRLYTALADLDATGRDRDRVAEILDAQALKRARSNPDLLPGLAGPVARVGGDRLAVRLLAWTEISDPDTRLIIDTDVRIWAVKTLSAIEPATLSAGDGSPGVRGRVRHRLETLALQGDPKRLKTAAADAADEFRRKLGKK